MSRALRMQGALKSQGPLDPAKGQRPLESLLKGSRGQGPWRGWEGRSPCDSRSDSGFEEELGSVSEGGLHVVPRGPLGGRREAPGIARFPVDLRAVHEGRAAHLRGQQRFRQGAQAALPGLGPARRRQRRRLRGGERVAARSGHPIARQQPFAGLPEGSRGTGPARACEDFMTGGGGAG